MLRASLPLYGRRANHLRGRSIVPRKTSLAEIYCLFRNYGRTGKDEDFIGVGTIPPEAGDVQVAIGAEDLAFRPVEV